MRSTAAPVAWGRGAGVASLSSESEPASVAVRGVSAVAAEVAEPVSRLDTEDAPSDWVAEAARPRAVDERRTRGLMAKWVTWEEMGEGSRRAGKVNRRPRGYTDYVYTMLQNCATKGGVS